MKLQRWLLVLLSVIFALGTVACGGGNVAEDPTQGSAGAVKAPVAGDSAPAEPPSEQPKAEEPVPEEPEGTTYPLTVKDASGTDITFEKAPKKIISIAPSETEVLFAIGAGANVIAVDDWSDYPSDTAALPKVGGMDANVEKILELEPDLVVAGWSLSMKTVELLRGLGLTVFTFETKSLDAAIAHIREMGTILNLGKEAEAVAVKMEADRKLVVDTLSGLTEAEKKRVYVEFSPGWTVGKGEFMDELLTLAGAINVADQEGWYEISEEKIIEANPDTILYSAGVEGLEALITSRAGWTKIDAITQGNMISVDDNLISRPGPRITDALVEVAKAIYPDQF